MSNATLREVLARIVSTRDATKQRIAADLDIAINCARAALAADDVARGAMQRTDMIAALRAGQQADADGVMVLVSRQACEEAATALESLQADFGRECDDADKILAALGLDLGQCRTDGGSLRVAKIVADLQASRAAAPQSTKPHSDAAYCDHVKPIPRVAQRSVEPVAEVVIRNDNGPGIWPKTEAYNAIEANNEWLKAAAPGTKLYAAPPTAPPDAEWREKVEAELANIALNYRRACDRWSSCRNQDGTLNEGNMDEAHAFEGKAHDCVAALRAHIATRPAPPTKKEAGA